MSVSLCFMPPVEQYQRAIRVLEAVEGYDQVALMLSLQDYRPLATVAFSDDTIAELNKVIFAVHLYPTTLLASLIDERIKHDKQTISPQLLAALEDCLTYCRNYPYADLEWR